MATSSLIASIGDHSPLVVVGDKGVDPELLPGVGLGSTANDKAATSLSQTCATIKQITAKLPVT